MSKKSQIAGQVFIYIMGIIMISLVIIFGYKAINDFIQKSEDISYIDFKTKLTTAIEGMSSEYGSVKKGTFTLPSGYHKACFIDLGKEENDVISSEICDKNKDAYEPIICNYWKGESGDNVFLIGKDVQAFSIGEEDGIYFTISAGYLCPKATNSRISLKIEGKGKHAELS